MRMNSCSWPLALPKQGHEQRANDECDSTRDTRSVSVLTCAPLHVKVVVLGAGLPRFALVNPYNAGS